MNQLENYQKYLKPQTNAFVAGAYNEETKQIGIAYTTITNKKVTKRQFVPTFKLNDYFNSSKRVAGEVLATKIAIKEAINAGFEKIVVYYHHVGVKNWSDGTWQTKTRIGQDYLNFINHYRNAIEIEFQKADTENELYQETYALAEKIAQTHKSTAEWQSLSEEYAYAQ